MQCALKFPEAINASRRYLAATVQQCAEKLAMRADFQCLKELVGKETDPATDDTWDERLEKKRGQMVGTFVQQLADACRRLHPTSDGLARATRHQFCSRLELCIKVGLSKHSPVQTNATLFGRTKLGPTCVACDRPFGGATDADGFIDKLALDPDDLVEVAAPEPPKPQFTARAGGFRQRKGKAKDVIAVSVSSPHLQAPGAQNDRAGAPDEMFFPDVNKR